ncbi:hypothetical protein [uncultured Ferrovibrio sp.]|jgi:hypothetical protein|uniref:hypothetical protein n=1 Tax=uncultured Ferrovibrio sp. TaxID=1576913 RepID=UPI00260C3F4A|nr:hypothetical protein [uncultured Ferrovibrio sp.]
MINWRQVSSSPFGLLVGFLVWASAFASIYAAVSLGCAMGWQGVTLGVITLQQLAPFLLLPLHIAILTAILFSAWRIARARHTPGFLLTLHGITAAFALAATLWTSAPLLLASNCGVTPTLVKGEQLEPERSGSSAPH